MTSFATRTSAIVEGSHVDCEDATTHVFLPTTSVAHP